MFQSVKYEKSCGIVTINNNQILLLHYPSGHWDFPKGHIHPMESEEQTALRELHEETGIQDIQLISGFRHISQYHYRRKRSIYRKKVVYFLGTTLTSAVTISHEHQGYLWLDWQSCFEKITFDNSQNILEQAHSFWDLHNINNK